MRKRISLLILCCAVCLLTGCSKDDLVHVYNAAIESIGSLPVVFNHPLAGERIFGDSHYVGDYQAEYKGFSGQECLFGGTSLQSLDEEEVSVTCTIDGSEGSAQLVFTSRSDDPVVLCEAGETFEGTVGLPAGSNYLNLKADDFTGSIKLHVE